MDEDVVGGREKEQHSKHLQQLEEDTETQTQKVEARVRKEVRTLATHWIIASVVTQIYCVFVLFFICKLPNGEVGEINCRQTCGLANYACFRRLSRSVWALTIFFYPI